MKMRLFALDMFPQARLAGIAARGRGRFKMEAAETERGTGGTARGGGATSAMGQWLG